MKQYCGVFGVKHLIKWLYPDAVKAFDGCAKVHDEQYKDVDWSLGDIATLRIDNQFWYCGIRAAGNDEKLQDNADTFYVACRKWGKMRAKLWKCFVSW